MTRGTLDDSQLRCALFVVFSGELRLLKEDQPASSFSCPEVLASACNSEQSPSPSRSRSPSPVTRHPSPASEYVE